MEFLNKYRRVILGVVAVAIVIAVAVVGWQKTHPLPEATKFKSRFFSFEYPRAYDAHEYAPGVVTIGHKNGEGLDPVVEVTRYQSDPDTAAPKSFDIFVKSQATALCGADGPIESINCTKVDIAEYTSPIGLVGKTLTLNLQRKNLKTGTTSDQAYGPMYIFNTTERPTLEDPLRYSAIFIYPSLSAYLSGQTPTELTQKILTTFMLPTATSSAVK